MIKCEYPGCDEEAQYALFQLFDNFTKKWVQLCDLHDRLIASRSRRLKGYNPNKTFEEVK